MEEPEWCCTLADYHYFHSSSSLFESEIHQANDSRASVAVASVVNDPQSLPTAGSHYGHNTVRDIKEREVMRSGRPAIITRLLGLGLVRLRPISPLDIMKSLAACTLFVLASSVCCVSAANTTDSTAGSTNGTRAAGPTSPDTTTTTTLHYCPLTCFCDFDSSLVSCAGTDDDDVVWVNRSSSNNNNTAAIPSDVWSVVAATKIQRLDVRDLVLERLDYSHLNGTGRLSELSLVRCGLAAIGAGTFARHSNLERLDLSQNQLTILSQNMLTGLIRLRSLDLSSNKLTLIDGALEMLITLEQLNLRGNALAVLGPDIFKGVSRLQFLNVDGNHIGAIAESAFQGLGQLAHLILSCNPLGEIQHVDLFAARPAYVDMSSAGLRSVPSLIARYVRDLRLSVVYRVSKFLIINSQRTVSS
ncbi:hypothetical protein DAPPUDRAFT_117745 [Daphnia pulex]|uniref:LRRNT domain-containing protein n=1 Tax=Daphnia pulex TaxID=6669 RepID=E9HTN5_DAPPU|nr:hypothetical protein DAPPUDRAFT_117745 [Daphnia pulex]|eukprot:EFX64896.1 hypothetical protein DAPPUDRAFT_117745 [Daphnia pulex]